MTPDFLWHPFWDRLGTVLVHFVWQALAVACVLAVVLAVWNPPRPQARYAVFLAAFLALPCCAAVTFIVASASGRPARGTETSRGVESQAAAREYSVGSTQYATPRTQYSVRSTQYGVRRTESSVPGTHFEALPRSPLQGLHAWRWTLASWLERVRPWLILGWLAGVGSFSLGMVVGAAAITWIKRRAGDVPAELLVAVRRLSRRLGVSTPRVVASRHVRQALAAGLFRPIIVLPASWATGLSPGMLEAILAHELAHLRRHDLWVNLLQRLVEMVFFYHPVVWWLSAKVRAERELCCDDLAVAGTGDRLGYATALELAARGQRPARELLLANGIGGRKMAVLERVRHVLNLETSDRGGHRWPGGVVALAMPALVWCAAAAWQPALADHDEVALVQDEGEREGDARGDSPEARRDRESPEARRDRERLERERNRLAQERELDRRDREDREGEAGDRGEREGFRPRGRRDGEDRGIRGPRDGEDRGPRGPHDGERPQIAPRDRDYRATDLTPADRDVLELARQLRQLRSEIEELRREVRELRESRPPRPFPPGLPPRLREGDRREPEGAERDEFRPDRRPDGPTRGVFPGRGIIPPARRDGGDRDRFDRERREREGDEREGREDDRERSEDADPTAREGAQRLPVPSLLGLYWKTAESRLNAAGLRAEFLQGRAADASRMIYRVYEQMPRASADAAPHESVKLRVFVKPDTPSGDR